MAFKDLQKQVDQWISQFEEGYWTPHEIYARLGEESGELAREINHRWGPKKKKSTEEKRELADEIADLFFTLICLANSQNIDLDEAWGRVMEKHNTRDENRFKKRR